MPWNPSYQFDEPAAAENPLSCVLSFNPLKFDSLSLWSSPVTIDKCTIKVEIITIHTSRMYTILTSLSFARKISADDLSCHTCFSVFALFVHFNRTTPPHHTTSTHEFARWSVFSLPILMGGPHQRERTSG